MNTDRDETRAYEFGEQAAMRGLTTDANPYRLHDLRAAWLRGYHSYKRDHVDTPMLATPEGKVFIARLKALLTRPS